MGSLVSFLGGARAEGLPPEREKLSRCLAEIASLEARVEILVGLKRRLEEDFVAKVAVAEQERDHLLDEGARSLVERLRGGLEASLTALGRRAETLGAKVAASVDQLEIVRRAIAKIDDELAEIADRQATLMALKGSLIQAVVNEAAGESLRLERIEAIDRLREVLTRCAALDRHLAPERADWAPAARICIVLPNLVWADKPAEEFILAPAREIAAAQTVLKTFSLALESSALVPAPEFPAVAATEDPDLEFARRNAPRSPATRSTAIASAPMHRTRRTSSRPRSRRSA